MVTEKEMKQESICGRCKHLVTRKYLKEENGKSKKTAKRCLYDHDVWREEITLECDGFEKLTKERR